MRFCLKSLLAAGFLALLWVTPAYGAESNIASLLPQGASLSGRIIQLLGLITILSLAPGLLIMVTSFTRFAIAFSLLRAGIGLQTTPSNMVMVSLALFMTFYVMAPSFNEAWKNGVEPLLNNQISEEQAIDKIISPFRRFMLGQVREKDLALFENMAPFSRALKSNEGNNSAANNPASAANQLNNGALSANGANEGDKTASLGALTRSELNIDLRILIPAFMISELRRGFEIGFLIVLPFLVIDLVVATLTMSMGMMMLPPTVLSLPFKVLFFVLIDGWNLLIGSLLRSFS